MAAARVSLHLCTPPPARESSRRRCRRIFAATPEDPSTTFSPPATGKSLPIRKVPGDYGLPIVGPLRDRLDYFYNQGREEFFRSKIRRYGSTVVRLNMPPGPPIASEPGVVAIFDGAAFPVLFDISKVEKKDLFTGTYSPSVELTGGYRVLSYLDPSEPNHALLKNFLFYLLGSRRSAVIPEFQSSFGSAFDALESELAEKGKADFGEANDQAAFKFVCRAFFGKDPADGGPGSKSPSMISKWILFQLAPIITLGLPYLVEDVALHTIRLPPSLIRDDYRQLYDFFFTAAAPALKEAEQMGLSKEEACHNIIFAMCFNAFGGFKILFPSMMKWVGRAGMALHTRLAEEVRTAVRKNGGQVTMRAMEEMPLLQSVVYETLRIEPPVPFQYGKAKRDLVIESHDAAYEVKRGEMLFGYQPFATRDPRIFERPEEFIGDRFVGGGEKLLEHLLWSNGPETGTASVENKQCAGKNLVVLAARLLLVELFLRYDSFDLDGVAITSFKKASF